MKEQSSRNAVHTATRASLLPIVIAATACVVATGTTTLAQSPDASDWGYYGGDTFGQRFSSLDEINRKNVSHLTVAWTYRTGETGVGFAKANKLSFESTPVLGFGLLYLETPTNIVIALEPETGTERWRFDPHIDRLSPYAEVTSRGVSLWEDPDPKHQGPCSRRVFTGTLDSRLLALDASTGTLCTDFAGGGEIDLKRGLRVHVPADYLITSPPAIYANVVVVGSSIGDSGATEVQRGAIRAFDARSGELLWTFDPLPDSPSHPAAPDWSLAQAMSTGAGNSWGVMSIDEEDGLVLLPTGSASPDFYGGGRIGANRFADSLLALNARSGKLVWQQQLIHHDLWDFDLAAQPVLGDIEIQGIPVPAVIQATRTGMLYVFDRAKGQPLFPIKEKPVPASQVPGEQAWPTQPFSSLPSLVSQVPLDPAQAWGVTIWDRGKCRELIAAHRNEGVFTPPDTRGTILAPGYMGGVDWGGIIFDEGRQRIIAAVNHLPLLLTLVPRTEAQGQIKSGNFGNSEFARQAGTPYAVRREPLLSPWGLPCTPPPWGTLVSVDLRRNRIAWQVPLGSTKGVGPWFAPTRDFGMPNMGGPIGTAGDLVFVGAAMDSFFRAFDIETGRELWKYRLPAGGQATPMTFRAGRNQRQFVVIAAGGNGGLKTPPGDYVIAFALPAPQRGEIIRNAR
jgi:quinoprotein glucose dehydrogenase